jgi:alpha-N-arabinofuranosidase
MRRIIWFAVLSLALVSVPLISQDQQNPVVIAVDAAHPGPAISKTMFGIFFEDINFAADGGLYPELVKNRSFEFQEPLTGWHEVLGFSSKGLDTPRARWVFTRKTPSTSPIRTI